jgi:hypothetical protein
MIAESAFARLNLRVAQILYRLSLYLGQRGCPDLQPRRWSNAELKRFGSLFSGSVVNVSGWNDGDKSGGIYRSYFPAASDYFVTNYPGSRGLEVGVPGALELDLEKPLVPEMRERFDVVFSHTVLEHIFLTRLALQNLVGLSRDVVVIVVPFIQEEHFEEGSYGDHWRWAPAGLRRALQEEGLEVLYFSNNDSHFFPIYNFVIASKLPERWRGHFPPLSLQTNRRVGAGLFSSQIEGRFSLTKLLGSSSAGPARRAGL